MTRMPEEMQPRYDQKELEAGMYAEWERSGYFNPDVCVKKGVTKRTAPVFSIVLPPPNVTGTLHMGHAAMLAVEDIMVRYHRMQGHRTLWVPGTDHAAIATQAKVESLIYKKEGKTRHDLGREAFLARVERFAQESHDTIVNQVKRMGSSLDWSREAYTLDKARNEAVNTAFERMYRDGLIYRGARLVNWDPKMQTTVSDDEIEWIEETVPFYYLQYGPFVIGTARPETKFGDKYVVMHPKDKRYAKYKHGDKLELEWINGPATATVIKDAAIDMEFGTGVMTITPWHDAADFDIAERHKLDREQIIDQYGKLLPIAGAFAGMHIKRARPLIAEKLREKGLLVKVDEQYAHRVATNSRGGGMIEPQIKEQWFVSVNAKFKAKNAKLRGIRKGQETTLKELMHTTVKSKQIQILPKRFEKVYHHWIDNLRDWCISRQIWYGHRIPVWYCLACGKPHVNPKVKSKWFLVRHGETDLNKEHRAAGGGSDVPLNETGIAQAQQAATLLQGQNIGLIISSHLVRARQTAEIIAKAIGAELVYDEELRERHMGKAESVHFDEIAKHWPNIWSDYETKAADNESYREMEVRISTAFKKHRIAHQKKNVVIVGHGAAFRTLMKHLRNLQPEESLAQPVIPNATPLQLDILATPCACGSDLAEQDPDTLDTWFSSGLWTFSTLGWPQKTKDLELYHPTSVLETGYDIIFFWVARMILMTGYLLGDIPFRHVYLHGLVRDAQGRKMSKSLGNTIDPLDLIEKYGADATRLSLIIGAAPGNDIKLSEDRVRGYRNFSTKIWNAARFVYMNRQPVPAKPAYTAQDKKRLAELAAVKKKVTAYIEAFNYNRAAETLYHYFWHTFADKVIESAKPRLQGAHEKERRAAYALLETILLESLKMLHPFVPFVTEAAYRKFRPEESLLIARW
jgi:valyl-tRNA synthetase